MGKVLSRSPRKVETEGGEGKEGREVREGLSIALFLILLDLILPWSLRQYGYPAISPWTILRSGINERQRKLSHAQ